MAFLSKFDLSTDEVDVLARAAEAAYRDTATSQMEMLGWSVVTPASLGLAASYQDGDFYRGGVLGRSSAIVFGKDGNYLIAITGTDETADYLDYPSLLTGNYIDKFFPLLQSVADQADADATLYVTGHSLGGAAVNQLAAIAGSFHGGAYSKAKLVSFASPIIGDDKNILNIGYANDPVFKSIESRGKYPSTPDNLIFVDDDFTGAIGTLAPLSAHAIAAYVDGISRLLQSQFLAKMTLDSEIVIDARLGRVKLENDDLITRKKATFYIGEDRDDKIIAQKGKNFIEGMGGDDNLKGSKKKDIIVGDSILSDHAKDNALAEPGFGDDFLRGKKGNDVLTGGPGDDCFVFDTSIYGKKGNIDKIKDFCPGEDKVVVDRSVFKKVKLGELRDKFFNKSNGSEAADATDRFTYEKDTGKLFYDRDGSGGRFESTLFAKLGDHLKISADDFWVIA